MKNFSKKILPYLKSLTVDRYLFVLYLVMTVLAIIFSVQVIASIHPNELQLVARYTAFGSTHLYRDQWFYQLVFALFIIMIAVVHILISKKTYEAVNRQLALLFAWFGVGLLVFAWITANSVLTVWSPL